MTREEIKAAVQEDFLRVVGKVIFPMEVDGYIGDDSCVLDANGLHPMEVLPTITSDIIREVGDGFFDPCWDVRPLYPDEFNKAVKETWPNSKEPMRSLWVYGHSYRIGEGPTKRAGLRYEDTFIPS